MFRIVKYIFLLLSITLNLQACNREKLFQQSRFAMDTLTSITVVSVSKEEAQRAIQAGFEEIERIGVLLNYYSEKSEITAINKAAGKSPVKVSKETVEIIQRALEIAELTGGAYDPTIGPVESLWDFTRSKIPESSLIKSKLYLVDFRKVHVDKESSTVFLELEGMELDLGGIAKGYGADKAIEVIKSHGIRGALVSVAGDIKCYGLKPGSQPWRIGIQNPRAKGGSVNDNILVSLLLKEQAISTSGDYQRFFIINGTRYHHLLDPETGMPATGLISVSLIAKEGVLADALCTGVFILGMEKGLKVLKSQGVEGIFVDKYQNVYITKRLTSTLESNKEYNIIE